VQRFPIHDITDTEFEQLVVLICRELLGPGVTSFAPGKDGGKDAKFVGTAAQFPSSVKPASGKFIIQAKHTSSPTGSCSDYDFETKVINEEQPKITRMFNDGELTHYLIFTNRRKTGGAEDRIPARISASTGVQDVWLRGYEDIERELMNYPHIVKAMGLDKLRSPIIFFPDDVRDVIVALHGQRSQIASTFDSEHDFRDYPGLPAKNLLNGLSPAYDAAIKEVSMPLFPEIERFLKNPRNTDLKEQYHAVANELKTQIAAHRDRFLSFDLVIENVYQLAHERSPELQSATRRRLLKTVLHYMYVDCEIGQKT
jgi:hypothetical protein